LHAISAIEKRLEKMAMTHKKTIVRIGWGQVEHDPVWQAYAAGEDGGTLGNLTDQGACHSALAAKRGYEHLLEEFRRDSRFEVCDEGRV
jgi:hypothetical protein